MLPTSRRRVPRWTAAVAVAALTAAGSVLAISATVPAHAGQPAAAGTRVVTLLTGDRVTVTPEGGLAGVSPGAGRGHTGFVHYTSRGHLFVVPQDAAPLLGARRLDPRLFDVTTLLDFGYGDAKVSEVPLIVTGGSAAVAGLRSKRTLTSVSAVTAKVDKGSAAKTWAALRAGGAASGTVWLDGKRHVKLDRSVPEIGAPTAWAAGFTGAGVKVAVLDTGIDATHPDLAGQVLDAKNFTPEPDTDDLVGHGTHVADTIAGTGAKQGGKYKGVAPGAKLLNAKICYRDGDDGICQESATLAGLQWAVEQGAKVLNMSLGGPDGPELDPVEQAVNTLSADHGVLVVAAAGNEGPGQSIGSPASADAALAVGAVDRAEKLAEFSSRGPRLGDDGVKPEITAPGVQIVAAKAKNGFLGTPVGDGYVSLSGTSMATPHVSGAAALLAQKYPQWTGGQLKAALMAGAVPNPSATLFEQGTGRVDVPKALAQTVLAEPSSLSLGVQRFPHTDDQPVRKQVRLRNTAAAPVTLALGVTAAGPDGKAAPAGMFAVAPASVTVPAGGDAAVTVTADTTVPAPDVTYTGVVTATGAGQPLRVPLAITREVPSSTVTFRAIDKDGRDVPMAQTLTMLSPLVADGLTQSVQEPTRRLVNGSYLVFATIGAEGSSAVIAYPNLVVDKDKAVVLDARRARPVSITVGTPLQDQATGNIVMQRTVDGRSVGFGYVGGFGFTGVSTAQIGPAMTPKEFEARFGLDGTAKAGGAGYHLAFRVPGQLPAGFTRRLGRGDLAEIRTAFGPAPEGASAEFEFQAMRDGATLIGATALPVTLPGARLDYLNPENPWVTVLAQTTGERSQLQVSPERAYRAGSTATERVNWAVFSPSIRPRPGYSAARRGDTFSAAIPLFTDSAGGVSGTRTDVARTTLLRAGSKVAESSVAGSVRVDGLPAADALYRLETEASRSGLSDLSTTVKAAWTFHSAHVPGELPVGIPLSVVRFEPKLDSANAARAGTVLAVPLTVQRQGTAGELTTISVEASFDDGKSWSAVRVERRVAQVQNPKAAGFAALRITAVDARGNTVEETVLRAYRIVA